MCVCILTTTFLGAECGDPSPTRELFPFRPVFKVLVALIHEAKDCDDLALDAARITLLEAVWERRDAESGKFGANDDVVKEMNQERVGVGVGGLGLRPCQGMA